MHTGETINELTALVERDEENAVIPRKDAERFQAELRHQQIRTLPPICDCCERVLPLEVVTSDSMPGLRFCSTDCRDFAEQETLDAIKAGERWTTEG